MWKAFGCRLQKCNLKIQLMYVAIATAHFVFLVFFAYFELKKLKNTLKRARHCLNMQYNI